MLTSKKYYYQECLMEEFAARIQRNPRYSLRSFALAIGVRHSALSQIMAGNRSISTKLIDRILERLEFSSQEQRKFLESVIKEKKEKGLKRISSQLAEKLKQISSSSNSLTTRSVGLDEFRIISDWYHTAILELTLEEAFKPDTRWIAKQLGISAAEAKLAVDRLLKLELLESVDGTYKKTNLKIGTKDKTKTSVFHRKRQKQILEKSIHALEHDPIEIRNHSGITMCIDPKNIPAAKQRIQKFIWEMGDLLTQGNQEQVYELNVSLFSLQQLNQTKINQTGEIKS